MKFSTYLVACIIAVSVCLVYVDRTKDREPVPDEIEEPVRTVTGVQVIETDHVTYINHSDGRREMILH